MRTNSLLLAALLGLGISCGAQIGSGLNPEQQHRVEAMLRAKVPFNPGTTLFFGIRSVSEIPGFDLVDVRYTSLDGGAGTIPLLLSTDGTRMAQFTSYEIKADPKIAFPQGDRPARGGPVGAPVEIVNYDDLECPFCARLNAWIFPALTDRYKDQVRIVYRSFPSDGHPWAMRAAIDTDCLAGMNGQAYWAAVDKIHASSVDYGGPERLIKTAEKQIDDDVRGIGRVFGVEPKKLDACIVAQDSKAEVESSQQGRDAGVVRTPTMFINGLKIEGAVSLEFLFTAIDQALVAAGKVPPAKYVPVSGK